MKRLLILATVVFCLGIILSCSVGFDEDVGYYSRVYNKTYNVGGTGKKGGIVFYDKGYYSDGWRYLECKANYNNCCFGYYRYYSNGSNYTIYTSNYLGEGTSNVETLVSSMGSSAYTQSSGTSTTSSYAAKVCYDAGWGLATTAEMQVIDSVLSLSGYFWTSITYDSTRAYYYRMNYGNGSSGIASRSEYYRLMYVNRF